jgi:hypothetical protein
VKLVVEYNGWTEVVVLEQLTTVQGSRRSRSEIG